MSSDIDGVQILRRPPPPQPSREGGRGYPTFPLPLISPNETLLLCHLDSPCVLMYSFVFLPSSMGVLQVFLVHHKFGGTIDFNLFGIKVYHVLKGSVLIILLVFHKEIENK